MSRTYHGKVPEAFALVKYEEEDQQKFDGVSTNNTILFMAVLDLND
ncbi:12484_t:CDS:2 [Ambispora leptoticha]|uniref:12484_t:CDS:1 n=1 Tax=Ambispora leptoticha TaxID=144679 RepID=A0A9N9FZ94_9GLOM|nr:12484_t:CDS:2 [Ambispora leptoticha]